MLATGLFAVASIGMAAPSSQECIAANEQALAHESQNRLLEARAAFLTCAEESCPDVIRTECLRRAEMATNTIPTIIFDVKDKAGQDVAVVEAAIDGRAVTDLLVGSPLEVDPGAHVFTFKVASGETLERRYVIQSSQKNRHELIQLEGAKSPAAATGQAEAPVTPPPEPPAHRGLGSQRFAALAVGGVGVVGLIVGSVYGATAMSRKSDAEELCPDSDCETTAGSQRWQDAEAAGNVSTVAFLAGGVAVAAGAVLWFTAPSRDSRPQTGSVSIGVGAGMMRLKGAF